MFARMVPLLLLTLILATGCSDDSTEPEAPDTFTLELSADPFGGGNNGGLAWVSSPDGAVLDVAAWSADTTLVFDLGEEPPATISYTMAVSNDDEMMLHTEFDVPAGTVRRWLLQPSLHVDHRADLVFENAPPCRSSMVSWQGASIEHNGGMISDPMISFDTDLVDVFTRLDPEDGPPVGAWLFGVGDGETHTIDLAADGVTSELLPHEVTVPEGGEFLLTSLGAYHDSGSRRGFIAFDRQELLGGVPASFTMFAPEWPDSELASMMTLYTGDTPPLSYMQVVTGGAPMSFTRMPGELAVTEPAPASMAFTMSGVWDSMSATWIDPEVGRFCMWWVSGSESRTEVVLPVWPAAFGQAYPEVVRDDFELRSVELMRRGDDGDDGATRAMRWEDWGVDGVEEDRKHARGLEPRRWLGAGWEIVRTGNMN